MRKRLLIGAVLWAVVTALGFGYLDGILAVAVAIFFGALIAAFVAAADWDSHSTYEERELVRNRRRKEKWAGRADVRARDRAKWEAHQARRAADD